MDQEVILFAALNFWAIVFGIIWGLMPDEGKVIVSVKPTKRPPAEAFESE